MGKRGADAPSSFPVTLYNIKGKVLKRGAAVTLWAKALKGRAAGDKPLF